MSIITQGREILLRWIRETNPTSEAVWPDVEKYKVLKAIYDTLDLYERIGYGTTQSGAVKKQIAAVRTCGRRAVEFHAGHLFPGTLPEALPIKTKNRRIIEPIHKTWEWSNWSARKQVYARWLCIRDTYIKVSQKDDGRPYKQLIEACHVPERTLDERGFVTYIRVSYPIQDKVDGQRVTRYHTEVWDKKTGTYRRWKTEANYADLDQLGKPLETKAIESFDIDFIPFVWAPFQEVAPGVACGVFEPFVAKMEEADHMGTRLHDMLFRYDKPLFALKRVGFGPDGRELPPARVQGTYSQSYNPTTDEWSGTKDDRSEPGLRTINKDPFLNLPSNTEPEFMVPQINYSDALAILQAMEEELHQDMPELLYPETKNTSTQESGIALRYRLAPAIDKALEARGNAEAGIIRADQMALTMGKNAGLAEFKNIGDFEQGDFEHTFEERDILPQTEKEDLEVEKMRLEVQEMKARINNPQEPAMGSLDRSRQLVEGALAESENGTGVDGTLDEIAAVL